MKSYNVLFVAIALMLTQPLLSGNEGIAELTGIEIMQKVNDKLNGESSYSEMTITTVRPDWSREMGIKSWTKGDDLAVIFITSPARDKGTVYLKRFKEVWNWLPTVERTIKLPPSMMMQSWMGTDFNNDDLVRQSSIVEDYTHTIIADSVIDGRQCYKIAMKPKPEAAVVWDEVITFIDKSEFITLKTLYYDEDGYLVNIMNFTDIRDFDGKILPGRMEMIPVEKEGHKTVLQYKELDFDIDVNNEYFSTQNIKRIRG